MMVLTPEELREWQGKAVVGKPVLWKLPNGGMVGEPCWVVAVDEDEDGFPCVLADEPGHDPECMERWNTMWVLDDDTREEAEESLARLDYPGLVYHVSDCESTKDRVKSAEK